MARPWRIEYEGACSHVLSRGNNRGRIFESETDHYFFMDCLARMAERFEVDICSYVLMPNHYHLLLQTHRANLSKAMQWLGTTYTRGFNLRHNRAGHLFQGRFKSIVVENSAYLMRLSLYIHRNPLRAGLVDRLADYRWSSYRFYAYGEPHPDWLKGTLILSQLDAATPYRDYRKMVQRYSDEEESLEEDLYYGAIYGTEGFAARIRSTYLHDSPSAAVAGHIPAQRDNDAASFLDRAASALGCDIQGLGKPARPSRKQRRKRDLLIYAMWKSAMFSNREIGNRFGLTDSAVSRRVRFVEQAVGTDQVLSGMLQRVKAALERQPRIGGAER